MLEHTHCSVVQFNFAHGWGELWGIANRTDYDLQSHAAASGKHMHIVDNNEKALPMPIAQYIHAIA